MSLEGHIMNKITSLDSDLRLKAIAGLELEVAKDMESPDRSLGELLESKIKDIGKDTEEDEDTEDSDDSL